MLPFKAMKDRWISPLDEYENDINHMLLPSQSPDLQTSVTQMTIFEAMSPTHLIKTLNQRTHRDARGNKAAPAAKQRTISTLDDDDDVCVFLL